jgi:hypothetical protein
MKINIKSVEVLVVLRVTLLFHGTLKDSFFIVRAHVLCRLETFDKDVSSFQSSPELQSEERKSDWMRHFLAADETFVNILLDLQVASIEIEVVLIRGFHSRITT